MKRNLMPNKGLPLSVNYLTDLPAKANSSFDSWYVICNFECQGKQLGFEWHHQTLNAGPAGLVVTAEFLMLNGTDNICIHNAMTEPVSAVNGSDQEKMRVFSTWGELAGDHTKMTLRLNVDEGELDIVLTPKKEVLFNGTTGLLHFIASDSHQFSFPNMDIEGTLTIQGKAYPIKNTTAWFDRQWGFEMSMTEGVAPFMPGMFQDAWLWLGLTLNKDNSEAISLWDAYQEDGRHAFATFLKKDGAQVNAIADVTYEQVWTSSNSGKSYPRVINISVPTEDFYVKLVSMISDPEFVRTDVNICGCQTLCEVTGSYQGEPIARNVVLELINDVCGEAY